VLVVCFRKIIIGKGKAVTSEYTTRGGAISVDRGWFVFLGEKKKERKKNIPMAL
jgi:hypothetical protein